MQSLRFCFTESESGLHTVKGNRPLRACGTRFISHKVVAINRLLDKYGAYIAHLFTLMEDSSVKQVDKQKLKGYVLKQSVNRMFILSRYTKTMCYSE